MSAKRKDSFGNVLRTGESQRKNGSYEYRYNDASGIRHSIYASTLETLRQKENSKAELLRRGITIIAERMTVNDLLEQYIDSKCAKRYTTLQNYNSLKGTTGNFGKLKVINVTWVIAQDWVCELSKQGYAYRTIEAKKILLHAAFEMATRDRIVIANPFHFRLSDVVKNNSRKKEGLTEEEQDKLFEFLFNDETYSRYYDDYLILLNSGLRISELAGLTISDVDFEKKIIRVNKQLVKKSNGELYIAEPKTKAGTRMLSLTPELEASFRRVIARRSNIERIVQGGYTGFIFTMEDGTPRTAWNFDTTLKRAITKYNKTHCDKLPRITPHDFRHTFCSTMAENGMQIKDLQTIMGHANVTTTLNIYTHVEEKKAAAAMMEIAQRKAAY